jgi:alpha-glucosidase
MYFSIPQALSFSLFGIPMFGTDTCGFNGNSDEELCNRWMSLSALFPFYRNHNTLSAISQEAYVWASVIDATKAAMNVRFQLLPYMYTLFHLANIKGDTVMRALAWEFPNDPSLANVDRQFFLGHDILVTPVLEQGATSVDGVFPGNGNGNGNGNGKENGNGKGNSKGNGKGNNASKSECYYDWYTQSPISPSLTGNITISAPLGHIPVYVRGGAVLATQPMALTTRDARKLPWSVLVALDTSGSAKGYLYLDDGESLNPEAIKEVEFEADGSALTAKVMGGFEGGVPLANVTVMGVQKAPKGGVRLNRQKVGEGAYDSEGKAFRVTGLEDATKKIGAWGADWKLEW